MAVKVALKECIPFVHWHNAVLLSNVQDFTKNKEKLWQDAKVFLDLKKIFVNLKKESKLKQFKDISVFFYAKTTLYYSLYTKFIIKKIKRLLNLFIL